MTDPLSEPDALRAAAVTAHDAMPPPRGVVVWTHGRGAPSQTAIPGAVVATGPEVVATLERGGLDLDASLALWERGEALADRCEAHLAGARERIEAVLNDGEELDHEDDTEDDDEFDD